MTDAPAAPSPPKAPPPELSTRAPRPRPVRVRRSAAIAIGLAAAALLGAALAWSFVVQPQLREGAQARAEPPRSADGASRPSELITGRPATYAQGDRLLPAPRRLAEPASEPAPPAPDGPRRLAVASPTPRPAPDLAGRARQSDLLFQISTNTPAAQVFEPLSPTPPSRPTPLSGLTPPRSPFDLQAGAIIPAALLTAVDTSRPGAVVAITTQGVFDTVTGQILLAPQGSRLIGRQDGASAYGDRRAFLVWERLILPNGKSLKLEGEPGVDAQGAHGVRGRADRRLWPLAQASLVAGAITTLGQAARDRDDGSGGWLGDAGDAAAIQAAQTGGRLIDRELDVAPSIHLAPGAPVRVLLTRDLTLEPYAP